MERRATSNSKSGDSWSFIHFYVVFLSFFFFVLFITSSTTILSYFSSLSQVFPLEINPLPGM